MDVAWIIRFVLVTLTTPKIVSSLECSTSESVACREEIQSLQEDQRRYSYASDDRTLDEMCRKQVLAVRCVNSFAEECLTGKEQDYFKTLVLGSDKFLDSMCFEDSKFRKAFLEHSPCIHNISQDLDNCSLKYQAAQKVLDSSEYSSDILLQKTCCIYFENIQCSSNVTSEVCGKDASRLVSDLLTLLSGTYLTERCKPYARYDHETCTLVARASFLLPEMSVWIYLGIFYAMRLGLVWF